MRVFLTGAGGFIGGHTLAALLSGRHEVLALERRRSVAGGPCKVLPGDLADIGPIREALARWQPEACIHLAWYVEPGEYLGSRLNIPMLTQSLELLRVLVDVGCQRVVTVGTCAEYDADAGWLQEDSPTQPETLYAAAKLALCQIGRQMTATGGHLAHARIFWPYGPGEHPNRGLPALVQALLRGQPFPATAGGQVRDYLHVADIAEGLRVLVEAEADGVYNISSGVPVTIRGLMETVGEITGRGHLIEFGAMPGRAWDPPFLAGDNRKLRGLGWAPKHSLREGLRETVEWWRGQLA